MKRDRWDKRSVQKIGAEVVLPFRDGWTGIWELEPRLPQRPNAHIHKAKKRKEK